MQLISSYPVLLVDDPGAVAQFYERWFGFERTFALDWYVSLRHRQRPESELAFLDPNHETVPPGFGARSQGVIVNLEVADAAAEYRRLVEENGLETITKLREEDFGQRHFVLIDPGGNLVDIIENTEPSAEFAEAYTSPEAPR